ncbi:MAG: CDGSH iron-sulfur domain-containing protein [Bacteroidota bacterium]
MESNIHSYESDDITVEFDSKRCIHSAECVKNLPSVFNPNNKPWITPQEASAERIREVVHHCPTGALKYSGSDDEEKPSRENTITIVPDGPLYLRGNIEIQNAEGETLLEDTRIALCRCGASKNKPLCDNTHKDIDFEASAGFQKAKLHPTDGGNASQNKLILKLMDNGPILVEGSYRVHSIANEAVNSSKNVAFCRCGKSSSKPFCDGTHKEVGFET